LQDTYADATSRRESKQHCQSSLMYHFIKPELKRLEKKYAHDFDTLYVLRTAKIKSNWLAIARHIQDLRDGLGWLDHWLHAEIDDDTLLLLLRNAVCHIAGARGMPATAQRAILKGAGAADDVTPQHVSR
jgi:hypothetical protein